MVKKFDTDLTGQSPHVSQTHAHVLGLHLMQSYQTHLLSEHVISNHTQNPKQYLWLPQEHRTITGK